MNKFDRFQDDIKNNYDEKVVINLSPSTSFRSRCEFSYGKNHYVMHDVNGKIYIKTFKDASLDLQIFDSQDLLGIHLLFCDKSL